MSVKSPEIRAKELTGYLDMKCGTGTQAGVKPQSLQKEITKIYEEFEALETGGNGKK